MDGMNASTRENSTPTAGWSICVVLPSKLPLTSNTYK